MSTTALAAVRKEREELRKAVQGDLDKLDGVIDDILWMIVAVGHDKGYKKGYETGYADGIQDEKIAQAARELK